MAAIRFKIACEASELEQVHRLNHATFVEEIPQHSPHPEGLLVDRFHDQNTYAVALDGERVVGMIAMRGTRPFSLDAKLDDLDSHLPAGRSLCEIRLLAVLKEYRRGQVFRGLIRAVTEHGLRQGYDLALISGTTRQLKLYSHLGFKPFGPRVGPPEAQYQPMFVTLEEVRERWRAFEPALRPVRLLPGPLSLHADVQEAFAAPSISHRCDAFAGMLRQVKARLRELSGAQRATLLFGSGTLANDAVGAQISLEGGAGIVLSNGEFGERLRDHAERFRLPHSVHRAEWGAPFDYDRVEELAAQAENGWIWAVHCETSTAILNDIEALSRICRRHGKRLYLDCISSLGTVPVNLSGVRLASGVSGKGLGSFAGVSMVLHDHEIAKAPGRLPRYLDLGCYAMEDEVPYTVCSNLVAALHASLHRQRFEERFTYIADLAAWLRAGLREQGLRILAPDSHASPAVTTIELPPQASSNRVGRALEEKGYELSYLSSYLLARNWIQVCLMGEISRADLEPLPRLVGQAVAGSRSSLPSSPSLSSPARARRGRESRPYALRPSAPVRR